MLSELPRDEALMVANDWKRRGRRGGVEGFTYSVEFVRAASALQRGNMARALERLNELGLSRPGLAQGAEALRGLGARIRTGESPRDFRSTFRCSSSVAYRRMRC